MKPNGPSLGDTLIWVHADPYHADDVVACSILSELHPGANIKRSRSPADGEFANFSVDVGGEYDPASGKFDHHQGLTSSHPEGFKKASAGLVWETFGRNYVERQALRLARAKQYALNDLARWTGLVHAVRDPMLIRKVAEMIRKSVILPIDAWDNGFMPQTATVPVLHFSGIVSALSNAGSPFSTALEFAQVMLQASVDGALVRALRTKCLKESAKIDHNGLVRLPVKPYSMGWVRKHVDSEGATMAYYVDGDNVDFVADDRLLERNQIPNKGRVSLLEFDELHKYVA